jgi:YD repeat-containing protein
LTAVVYPGGAATAYTYDANGNRTSRTSAGSTTTYTYNDADRLTAAGGVAHTYDNNGNLLTRGSDTFSWDYASRMTGATVAGTSATYAYAGDDTRASKTTGRRHHQLPLGPRKRPAPARR